MLYKFKSHSIFSFPQRLTSSRPVFMQDYRHLKNPLHDISKYFSCKTKQNNKQYNMKTEVQNLKAKKF